MRYNGTLSYGIITEGGLNEYGEVQEANVSWSGKIPCSIKVNSDTRKGKYEDGEFRQASFTILTESQNVPIYMPRIKLERNGEPLGEYRVLSAEPLITVGRVQIMV